MKTIFKTKEGEFLWEMENYWEGGDIPERRILHQEGDYIKLPDDDLTSGIITHKSFDDNDNEVVLIDTSITEKEYFYGRENKES